MAFIERLLRDPLALIFTLISLFYAVRGLRLVRVAWERRDALRQEPLTGWKKRWVEQADFYVSIPPGVLIHETGHALAVLAFGGRVVEFGFGFYWGYVLPAGTFTAAQEWFISLAGTLGTLVYSIGLWLLLRRSEASAWRYFGLRALRVNLIYALVYYPLFTFFTFIGDWRTIYDFGATPLLSGITLLVHLGLLALFWRANRQGWFEMPAFRSAAEEDEFRKLREQAAQNPDNERLQLRTIEALRQRGSTKEAKEQLHAFLRDHPRSAEGHLILAFLESQNKRQLPTNARRHVEQALRLGLSGSENVAAANALLGQYYLNVERLDEAVRYLDAAVAAAQAPGGNLNLAHLHYLRALVQRRQRRYDAALQDIEEAIRLAQARNQEQAAAQYQREKELIIHHGGSRPLP